VFAWVYGSHQHGATSTSLPNGWLLQSSCYTTPGSGPACFTVNNGSPLWILQSVMATKMSDRHNLKI